MENQVAQTLNWVDKITEMVIEYAPKLGLALVLLFIGLRVCNWIARIAGKAMETAGISHNIVPFLRSLVGISLKVLLIFSVASLVGIDTASFLAVLAAAADYCRPEVCSEPVLDIREGRHPVLDRLMPSGEFVPNDVRLGVDIVRRDSDPVETHRRDRNPIVQCALRRLDITTISQTLCVRKF